MDSLSETSASSASEDDGRSLSSWDQSLDSASDADSPHAARQRRRRQRPLDQFDEGVGDAILADMRLTRALRQRTQKRVDSKRYVVDDGADRIGDQTTSLAPGQAKPRLLQRLRAICLLGPSDAFFDVGSGEGFAAVALSAATGCHAYGVEIVPWRHQDSVDIAKKFCKSMRRSADFAELCGYGHPGSRRGGAASGRLLTIGAGGGALQPGVAEGAMAPPVPALPSDSASLDVEGSSVGPPSTSSFRASAEAQPAAPAAVSAAGGLTLSPSPAVSTSASRTGSGSPPPPTAGALSKPAASLLLRSLSGGSGGSAAAAIQVSAAGASRASAASAARSFSAVTVPASCLATRASVRCILCAAQAFGRGQDWGPHAVHCSLPAAAVFNAPDAPAPAAAASPRRKRVEETRRSSSSTTPALCADLVRPLRSPHPEFEFAALVQRALNAAAAGVKEPTSAAAGAGDRAKPLPSSPAASPVFGAGAELVSGPAAEQRSNSEGVVGSLPAQRPTPQAIVPVQPRVLQAAACARAAPAPAVGHGLGDTAPRALAVVRADTAGGGSVRGLSVGVSMPAAFGIGLKRAFQSTVPVGGEGSQGPAGRVAGDATAVAPSFAPPVPLLEAAQTRVGIGAGSSADPSSSAGTDAGRQHPYALVFAGWGGRAGGGQALGAGALGISPPGQALLSGSSALLRSTSLPASHSSAESVSLVVPAWSALSSGASSALLRSWSAPVLPPGARPAAVSLPSTPVQNLTASGSSSSPSKAFTSEALAVPVALPVAPRGVGAVALGGALAPPRLAVHPGISRRAPPVLPLHRRIHFMRGDALQLLARGPALDALRRSRVVFCNNFDAKWTEDGFQQAIFRLLSRNMARGAILVSCSRFTRGVRRCASESLARLSVLLRAAPLAHPPHLSDGLMDSGNVRGVQEVYKNPNLHFEVSGGWDEKDGGHGADDDNACEQASKAASCRSDGLHYPP